MLTVNHVLLTWNTLIRPCTHRWPLLVSAPILLSRLDYCNSLLSRLPWSTIQPLQRVMNAAARVITNLSIRDHVKPALKELHWLLAEQRITYKLCLFMHLIQNRQAPQYLIDYLYLQFSQPAASTGWSQLILQTVLPRTRTTFRERGFCYSGIAAWNNLPSHPHYRTDTDALKTAQECTFWACFLVKTSTKCAEEYFPVTSYVVAGTKKIKMYTARRHECRFVVGVTCVVSVASTILRKS